MVSYPKKQGCPSFFLYCMLDRPKHEQKMESDVQTFLAENRACDVRRDIEPI